MSYPTPIPTQISYQASSCCDPQQITSGPLFINSPTTRPPNTIFLSPHSEYLLPVTAIHNCKYHLIVFIQLFNTLICKDRANKEDPNELSFSKGEVLYVHEKKGSWWQAKKSNGAIGMIPSNYVSLNRNLYM